MGQTTMGGGGWWGGGTWVRMDTHCQTDVRSRNSEYQNLGAVSSFWGKKGGGQLQTKKIIGAIVMFVLVLFCKILIHGIHWIESCVEEFGYFE